LHGGTDIEPLEQGCDGVGAGTVRIFAGRAPATGERSPGVGESNGASGLGDLGFETIAGPDDPDDLSFLIEVVPTLGDAARQITQNLTTVDVEETGWTRRTSGWVVVTSHSLSSYQERARHTTLKISNSQF
jgi:hypothetical protein